MEPRYSPISVGRAFRLLLGLRLRRSLTTARARLGGAFNRRKRAAGRSGTPRKQRSGWLFIAFFGLVFVGNGLNLSAAAVRHSVGQLGEAGLPGGAGVLLLLLTVTLVLTGIGLANKELAKLDWDMEWLLTLPASVPVLYVTKIAERTIGSFFGWFTVFPFLTVLCWHGGLRWGAPFVALALSLPLFAIIAIAQVLIEAAVRTFCPATVVRNGQAVATVVGLLGLVLVISPGTQVGATSYFLWHWMRSAPAGAWLPFTQPARLALSAGDFGGSLGAPAAWLVVETAVVVLGGWLGLRVIHAHGIVAGRGALQGRRGGGAAKGGRLGLFKGVIGKDLRRLARDRAFLASTLIVPAVIVGMQVVFNPKMLTYFARNATHWTVVAFAFGAYLLLMSTSQVLNAEGPALWLLYTVPARLERLLLRKTLMWAPFACAYTVAVLAYGVWVQGFSSQLLIAGVYALAGLPIYALIGGALGIFGTDPTVREASKRLRVDLLYLFMLLEGLYVYGFYAPTPWAKVPLFVLLGALALALWQNVGRRIPYLLDPVSLPPPTVALSDGLIAALFFFVLQGLLVAIFRTVLAVPMLLTTLLAFAGAGLLVVAGAILVFWHRKVVQVPETIGLSWGRGRRRAVREGLLWSVPALLVAVGYAYVSTDWTWLAHQIAAANHGSALFHGGPVALICFGALVLLAAPLCEEIIFRGLIFRGLRRSFGTAASVLASAAIFAAMHPPLSFVPVFVMAVFAALAFERSKSLVAPMLVHALYNTVWLLTVVGTVSWLRV